MLPFTAQEAHLLAARLLVMAACEQHGVEDFSVGQNYEEVTAQGQAESEEWGWGLGPQADLPPVSLGHPPLGILILLQGSEPREIEGQRSWA